MSEKTKGYLYLAVCLACIVTCMVLIASIFFDKTETAQTQFEQHSPQIQKQINTEKAAAQGEMIVTQDYAAAVITSILPSELPITNVGVQVEKSGRVSVSGDIAAEKFKDFLAEKGANLGVKEWLTMKFMGEKASLCLSFDCKIGQEGKITLAPNAIKINKHEINLKIIPAEYSEKMSVALTEVMRGTGFVYSNIELRDGAIVLIA